MMVLKYIHYRTDVTAIYNFKVTRVLFTMTYFQQELMHIPARVNQVHDVT